MGVTSGSLDLKSPIIDSQKGDIKGTATQVVDNDLTLATSAIKTISDSGGCGFVDDTDDVKPSDDASVFRSLSLVVIEVGGDGYDGVLHRLPKVTLCHIPHLAQDHCGNFLGAEVAGFALHVNRDRWFVGLILDFEGEVLEIGLDILVGPLATNQAPICSQPTFRSIYSSDTTHLASKIVRFGFEAY